MNRSFTNLPYLKITSYPIHQTIISTTPNVKASYFFDSFPLAAYHKQDICTQELDRIDSRPGHWSHETVDSTNQTWAKSLMSYMMTCKTQIRRTYGLPFQPFLAPSSQMMKSRTRFFVSNRRDRLIGPKDFWICLIEVWLLRWFWWIRVCPRVLVRLNIVCGLFV